MKQHWRPALFALTLALCSAIALETRAAEEKAAAVTTPPAKTRGDNKGDNKPLPSAKEILDRYGKAVGGEDAFLKHKSQHAKGTVEMPAQRMKGNMEVFAHRPNKLLLKVTMPGLGETVQAFDGKIAWASNPLLGPMLVEGKARDQIATQADFDHALHDPDHYKVMEVLGVEDFNGEECYKVKLVHRSGFESTEFFSVKSGLQRGFITTQEAPLVGAVTTTSVVTDYKHFGDLFMPSRISQKMMGMETIMTIEEMEYDKVDPSVFDLPAEVKALLEKPASPTAEKAGGLRLEPKTDAPKEAK